LTAHCQKVARKYSGDTLGLARPARGRGHLPLGTVRSGLCARAGAWEPRSRVNEDHELVIHPGWNFSPVRALCLCSGKHAGAVV
jgi:hypothetical protein